jgi:hypothetical protein
MTPIQPKYTNLLLLIVVITVIAILGWVFVFSVNFTDAAQKVTLFSTVISVPLWLFYEKFGWRWKYCRIWGWLCDTPNLNGRWEGTINRRDNRGEHKFVLEISQTWTNIQCVTFSESSTSTSLTADILSTLRQDAILFVYTTEAEVRRDINGTPLNVPMKFYVTTIVRYNPKEKSLNGQYYTNRDPQTRGEFNLRFVTFELARSFYSGEESR